MKTMRPFRLSFGRNVVIMILALIVSLSGLLLSGCGCELQKNELTVTGFAAEPHMVWNGSHFGIVYYWTGQSFGWPEIRMVLVDKNGNVVQSRSGLGSVQH